MLIKLHGAASMVLAVLGLALTIAFALGTKNHASFVDDNCLSITQRTHESWFGDIGAAKYYGDSLTLERGRELRRFGPGAVVSCESKNSDVQLAWESPLAPSWLSSTDVACRGQPCGSSAALMGCSNPYACTVLRARIVEVRAMLIFVGVLLSLMLPATSAVLLFLLTQAYPLLPERKVAPEPKEKPSRFGSHKVTAWLFVPILGIIAILVFTCILRASSAPAPRPITALQYAARLTLPSDLPIRANFVPSARRRQFDRYPAPPVRVTPPPDAPRVLDAAGVSHAASVVISAQPAAFMKAGVAISPTPAVRIVDQFGNITNKQVAVTMRVLPATGEWGRNRRRQQRTKDYDWRAPVTKYTGNTGRASFDGTSVDETGTGYRLMFSVLSSSPMTTYETISSGFTIRPALPVRFDFLQPYPPSTLQAGGAVPPIAAPAVDRFFNLASPADSAFLRATLSLRRTALDGTESIVSGRTVALLLFIRYRVNCLWPDRRIIIIY